MGLKVTKHGSVFRSKDGRKLTREKYTAPPQDVLKRTIDALKKAGKKS